MAESRRWTRRGHVSSVPEDIVALEPGMDQEWNWKERERRRRRQVAVVDLACQQ